MEKLIQIIMKRDGLGRDEAAEMVKDTMEEVNIASGSGRFTEAENIFMEDLGLEPDYLLSAIM